jgi:hypothetical protein
MSITRIPVGVFVPTLTINNTNIANRWTESDFNNVLNIANQFWQVAKIEFRKTSFNNQVTVELLNQNSSGRLIRADQLFIGHRFRPTTAGVSVVLVNEAESSDRAAGVVGGTAMQVYRSCLLAYSSNPRTVGLYLAHEFGHLLGLHDIYTGNGNNLMYGALGTGVGRLNPSQCRIALREARLLIQTPRQTRP